MRNPPRQMTELRSSHHLFSSLRTSSLVANLDPPVFGQSLIEHVSSKQIVSFTIISTVDLEIGFLSGNTTLKRIIHFTIRANSIAKATRIITIVILSRSLKSDINNSQLKLPQLAQTDGTRTKQLLIRMLRYQL